MEIGRRGFLGALTAALVAFKAPWSGESIAVELDTTLDVAAGHGDRIGAGYVLLNTRTREQIMVTSVMKDSITVLRGVGSMPLPFEASDDLIIVATPHEYLPASVDGPRERWFDKATYPRTVKLIEGS